jgi:hypothetical protein
MQMQHTPNCLINIELADYYRDGMAALDTRALTLLKKSFPTIAVGKEQHNVSMSHLFPHFVRDLVHPELVIDEEFLIGWSLLVRYTQALDALMDNHTDRFLMNPSDLACLQFAATECLSRYFAGSGSHDQAWIELNATLRGQLAEARATATERQSQELHIEKNRFLNLAVLAVERDQPHASVLEDSRPLLSAIQILDDITDFFDDFTARNETGLVQGLLRSMMEPDSERSDVLRALVSSGALRSQLRLAMNALSKYQARHAHNVGVSSPGGRYLAKLVEQLASLELILTDYEGANVSTKASILGEISSRIEYLAVSSV